MNNKITQIIQAIPNILNQAKSQYKDDNSIIQIAKKQGVDLNNVLNLINQYESNPIVNNVAKQFGVDIGAVKNKISGLLNVNNSTQQEKNNNLDRFR
jgi:hypothetical protein